MRMVIEDARKDEFCKVEDLYIGEVFVYQSYMYIKIKAMNTSIKIDSSYPKDEKRCFAINLKSGTVRGIKHGDMVQKINAKIVLQDITDDNKTKPDTYRINKEMRVDFSGKLKFLIGDVYEDNKGQRWKVRSIDQGRGYVHCKLIDQSPNRFVNFDLFTGRGKYGDYCTVLKKLINWCL